MCYKSGNHYDAIELTEEEPTGALAQVHILICHSLICTFLICHFLLGTFLICHFFICNFLILNGTA